MTEHGNTCWVSIEVDDTRSSSRPLFGRSRQARSELLHLRPCSWRWCSWFVEACWWVCCAALSCSRSESKWCLYRLKVWLRQLSGQLFLCGGVSCVVFLYSESVLRSNFACWQRMRLDTVPAGVFFQYDRKFNADVWSVRGAEKLWSVEGLSHNDLILYSTIVSASLLHPIPRWKLKIW